MAPVKGQGAVHVRCRLGARRQARVRLNGDGRVGPVPELAPADGNADESVELDRVLQERVVDHPNDQIAPETRRRGQLVSATAKAALCAEGDGAVDRRGEL